MLVIGKREEELVVARKRKKIEIWGGEEGYLSAGEGQNAEKRRADTWCRLRARGYGVVGADRSMMPWADTWCRGPRESGAWCRWQEREA